MMIESDKFYKTREGYKAYVSLVDTEGQYNVQGTVLGHIGVFHWTSSGLFRWDDLPDRFDLVAPWEEG